MNTKDLFIPMALAILTVLGMRYFFSGPEQSKPVSTFLAPLGAQESKPLNTELKFNENATPSTSTEQTVIETPWARLTFSSNTGSLVLFEFKRAQKIGVEYMTVFDRSQHEQGGAFTVCFDAGAPRFYVLKDQQETLETVSITYRVQDVFGSLDKTFIVHKNKCNIDLNISLNPTAESLQPRIFVLGPQFYRNLDAPESSSALIIDNVGKFEKITADRLVQRQGWLKPVLFGIDDRYFVHVLFNDANQFVQRAYYTSDQQKNVASILEGPLVHDQHEWKLSFYCGPKTAEELIRVDDRLEKILDHWWPFSFIARFLMMTLNWLYSYVHNYGLAIIVLTVLIRLLFLPLTFRSEADSKKQAELQKKLAYLKQRYKNDPQALLHEQTELIKKYGLGIGRMIPHLLQLPILFILSRVVVNSVELYKAPMWWISDLSAKDPYYILPAFACLASLIQAFTVPSAQARLFGIASALILGAVVANFSAGLALYLLVSVALALAQTRVIRALGMAG